MWVHIHLGASLGHPVLHACLLFSGARGVVVGASVDGHVSRLLQPASAASMRRPPGCMATSLARWVKSPSCMLARRVVATRVAACRWVRPPNLARRCGGADGGNATPLHSPPPQESELLRERLVPDPVFSSVCGSRDLGIWSCGDLDIR